MGTIILLTFPFVSLSSLSSFPNTLSFVATKTGRETRLWVPWLNRTSLLREPRRGKGWRPAIEKLLTSGASAQNREPPSLGARRAAAPKSISPFASRDRAERARAGARVFGSRGKKKKNNTRSFLERTALFWGRGEEGRREVEGRSVAALVPFSEDRDNRLGE